jgi:hypothetical protein
MRAAITRRSSTAIPSRIAPPHRGKPIVSGVNASP